MKLKKRESFSRFLETKLINLIHIPKGAPKILMSGCPMAVPNWKRPLIIETTGAVIVGEESCVGKRGTRNLAKIRDLSVHKNH